MKLALCGRRLIGWIGASLLSASLFSGPSVAQAQQQSKPNILFIMGDDIGWMQPSIYHRGLMVGETPNIDRIGQEGAVFMDYVAMQSCTSGRNAFFTGMYPLRTGMIPPQLPGSPSYLRPGTPALAKFLLDLGYTTGEFGKNHLGDHTDCTADGAWLPGILGLPLSPRCHAAGELPRHQQESERAGRRTAVQEHADPRDQRGVRRRRSENDALPDATAPGALVQILRRHREEPDLQRRRPADTGAFENGGRGDLRQGDRLPRPQRSQEDQQALLRLVQPGAHARRDGAVAEVRGHAGRDAAARTGASTKPA